MFSGGVSRSGQSLGEESPSVSDLGVTCGDFPLAFSASPIFLSSECESFVRVCVVFIVLASHTIAVRVIIWQVDH